MLLLRSRSPAAAAADESCANCVTALPARSISWTNRWVAVAVAEKLPKVPGSDMPYVEGFLYLLLTGDVPTKADAEEVVAELKARAAVPHYVFDVPVRGSLPLLYALSLLFMWGTLGIGIYVSTAARTVPQAMQLSFLTFLPSIYLSGLLFPIEGMPTGAQYLAAIIPLTYYLRVVRGIVLKGVGLDYLWPSALPLVAFGAVIFTLAVLRFRKSLD